MIDNKLWYEITGCTSDLLCTLTFTPSEMETFLNELGYTIIIHEMMCTIKERDMDGWTGKTREEKRRFFLAVRGTNYPLPEHANDIGELDFISKFKTSFT